MTDPNLDELSKALTNAVLDVVENDEHGSMIYPVIHKHLTALSEQWEKRVKELEAEQKQCLSLLKVPDSLYAAIYDLAKRHDEKLSRVMSLETERDQLAMQIETLTTKSIRLMNEALLYRSQLRRCGILFCDKCGWPMPHSIIEHDCTLQPESLRAELAKGTQ